MEDKLVPYYIPIKDDSQMLKMIEWVTSSRKCENIAKNARVIDSFSSERGAIQQTVLKNNETVNIY